MLRRAGVVAAGVMALGAAMVPVQAHHLVPSPLEPPAVVEVLPNRPAVSTPTLPAGTYALEASGVVRWDANPRHTADPECTTFTTTSDWRRNRFPAAGADGADLQVDGRDVEWVPAQSDRAGCSTAPAARDRSYRSFVHLQQPRALTFSWQEPSAAPDPAHDSGALTVRVQPLRAADLGAAVPAALAGVEHAAIRFAGTTAVPVDGSSAGLATMRSARYLAVASGHYVWNDQGGRADPECSTAVAADPVALPHRYPGELLDLLVRERVLDDAGETRDWRPVGGAVAPCDEATHTYFATFLSESTFTPFRVNDGEGADNIGYMAVSLFALEPPPADAAEEVVRPGSAVTVAARADDPSGAGIALGAGVHHVQVAGTWSEGGVAHSVIDAECMVIDHGPRWPDGRLIWMRDRLRPDYDPLRFEADHTPIGDVTVSLGGSPLPARPWVSPGGTSAGCDEVHHRYETFVTVPTGGAMLRVSAGDIDGQWANNQGRLEVTAAPVLHHSLPAPVQRYVTTVAVSARDGSVPTASLSATAAHLLLADGTYAFRSWTEADSACTGGRRQASLFVSARPEGQALGAPADPDWSPAGRCQPHSNRYWTRAASGLAEVGFSIPDVNTADNFGHLWVHVFEEQA